VSHQLSVISGKKTALETATQTLKATQANKTIMFADIQTNQTAQAQALSVVQTQIADMQTQIATLTDFYGTFQLSNLVTKDASGNVDLLSGTLRAKNLVTEGLSIDTTSAKDPTIGTATLYPVAVDADSDGKDDFSNLSMTDPEVVARDGKSIVVKTGAVGSGSRIFVTPKKSLGEALAVTDKKKGSDFTVSLKNAVTDPVAFDWLIVEEK
jgi:hypothetical protein